METRSKSQSGKNEPNMATENHSTGKTTLNKLNNNKKSREEKSNSDANSQLSHSEEAIENNELLNKNVQDDESTFLKGLVATRIDQINNTPVNSPMPTKQKENTKARKKNKLKMIGAKHGKLRIEEQENSEESACEQIQDSQSQHDQQEGSGQQAEQSSDSLVSILKELTSTVKRLESKIDNMEQERKINSKKVRQMAIVQSQDAAAITSLTETSQDHTDQIKALTGTVIRQQQQIQDLTHKLNNLYANNNNKKLAINGLAETQGENCYHEVANFFKNVMKIDVPIQLKFARRIGSGTERPIMIKLKTFEQKTLIFQNFDKLKTANRGRQRPYFITDQLPEAWAERRRFIQNLKFQNSKLPTAAQRKIEVTKRDIQIDGVEYQPMLVPPTIADVVGLKAVEKANIQAVEITQGESEDKDKSRFIGYAAEAYSIEQVKRQYLHLRLLHPEASHIMAAYKIPGTDFATNQGLSDDGEYGGARCMMKVLNKEKKENTAVFVVRYYGGKHLGAARFLSIERAAKSALTRAAEALMRVRRLPTQQELQQINQEIQQAAQRPTPKDQNPIRYNWGSDEETENSGEDSQAADTSQDEDEEQD